VLLEAIVDLNLAPVLGPVVQLATIVVAGVAPLLANKAIAAFEKRTGIHLNQAQVQAVHDAADTAAGVVQTMLARGELQLDHLHVDNPQIAALAATALNAVPAASDAVGVTVPDVAHMILGRVGKLLSADPTVQTVPATTTVVAVPHA
jgi:hypothetical protein